jgi:transposase
MSRSVTLVRFRILSESTPLPRSRVPQQLHPARHRSVSTHADRRTPALTGIGLSGSACHHGSPAGIVYVLRIGVGWRDVPAETVDCSAVTALRRLRDRTEAGVRPRLHAVLLTELRRAGSRLPPPSSGARHQTTDRPSWRRPRLRSGQDPVGGRAHVRLTAPVQGTPHPLRKTCRPPPGPARTRLQHHLPPTTPKGVLKTISYYVDDRTTTGLGSTATSRVGHRLGETWRCGDMPSEAFRVSRVEPHDRPCPGQSGVR